MRLGLVPNEAADLIAFRFLQADLPLVVDQGLLRAGLVLRDPTRALHDLTRMMVKVDPDRIRENRGPDHDLARPRQDRRRILQNHKNRSHMTNQMHRVLEKNLRPRTLVHRTNHRALRHIIPSTLSPTVAPKHLAPAVIRLNRHDNHIRRPHRARDYRQDPIPGVRRPRKRISRLLLPRVKRKGLQTTQLPAAARAIEQSVLQNMSRLNPNKAIIRPNPVLLHRKRNHLYMGAAISMIPRKVE